MIDACWNVLLALAPWLLLGACIAGAMHILFPKNFIQGQLQGWGGVAKAVLIGVPLPLCSCGVIPAGMGLKRDGASDGATLGFLISTPQTGIDSILVSASFLGWPFALFKLASAALMGWVGGALTLVFKDDRFSAEKDERFVETSSENQNFREAFHHGLFLIQSIWRWLVVGILISAAIEVFIPHSTLAHFGTMGPVASSLAVLAISVPLYVCATSSVPIAAALVAGGMPTGLALVFLMAGPATNVATIGVIYRGFGIRVLLIYLGVILVGSTGLGLAFDMVWAADVVAESHEHGSAWWELGSGWLLAALFCWFFVQDARSWFQVKRVAAISESSKVEVDVNGMTCGGCVSRLQKVLSEIEGVDSAAVTLEPGKAIVVGTVSPQRVEEGIVHAGFEVGNPTPHS